MRRCIGLLVLLLTLATAWGAAPPAKPRALTAEEEKEVADLQGRLYRHARAGEFEQSAKVAQQMADFRHQRQGAGHWQTIDARFKVDEWRRLARVGSKDRAEVVRARTLDSEGVALVNRGRFREAETPLRKALEVREKVLGKEHADTAHSYNNLAFCLQALGKHSEALPLYRQALRIFAKALGLEHPSTATGYSNVAYCLNAQGKDAEALPLFRQALLIEEKVLGKEHPSTAYSYNNVAGCLNALGKHSEALPLLRQALLIREKVLGKGHRDTALSYNNVAACLQQLGKVAEALPLHRQALLIREKVLGKEHPSTALSYNNLAACLSAQGKHAEALTLYRQALRIYEKALGKEHPSTALSYNNVAFCLSAQGKHSEALTLYRRALEIREKVLGKGHPDTALSYNNVAACLDDQGKHSETLPLYRQALLIREKALGKEHPDTALSYNNVAACLDDQGKHSEALPLYRQALLIREKALGKEHPSTAISYNNVAFWLWEQDRSSEAVRLWQQSLRGQEAARVLRAESGFDRAQRTRGISVRAALAVGLARLKQPGNAFAHAEASLARGLLDDLSPLTAEQRTRADELRGRLAKLEPALASFSASGRLGTEQRDRHERLRKEYGRLWQEWSDLLASASARAVLPLERIQRSIPDDAALVLFIQELGELWACVVRSEGTPRWLQLRRDSAPTALAKQLYSALIDPASDSAQRRKLLAAFRKARLDPLRPHLRGVKRLFVVPTGELARIPAELLTDEFAVSYTPSGSVLAHVRENHRGVDGSSLLAVGDPIFDRVPPPEPPASGLLVLSVVAGSHAAKASLQAGDVLLSVGPVRLSSHDDLQEAFTGLPAKALVWRDGRQFTTRLTGSPLGAVFDPRSARAAVRAWRRDHESLTQRGTGHKRLPGTRLEAEAIATLVKGNTSLLGSDASEQRLDALQAEGKLKGYRLIHIATHGEPDDHMPERSAVILAQDKLPDPLKQAQAGKHVYEGRLTVSRIRDTWELDADLVVLSACETGLGKEAKGDGLLGFAQAFLSKGARSVMLSRWKVDDTATALLMIRFYENLLGKRKDLKKALGRAASLDEAKKWLRSLSRKDAERLATLHTGGVLRGSEGVEKMPPKAKPVELKGDRPFAHPYYWAAFTLVGDPD